MKRAVIFFKLILVVSALYSQVVVNGIPWYDTEGRTLSAHGANIIFESGRYYMFGEFKTDSANVFTGFSCYSSTDLSDWHFEGLCFEQQQDGRMGPRRVGERPKVLRCPSTGEYVMLMHTDNLQYKDPCTCYATSRTITGPYEFKGPILYRGQPVKRWDIGSFVDDDGHAYLLVHHGGIYRLAPDFHSLDSCMTNGQKGVGESPAMMKKDGIYYWLSSHTTSWERNDNIYWTSTSLNGPWTYGGEFCPKGTLTWNSQCTFVLPLPNGTYMYMGDRWSFPRQRSAATYVWLPIKANEGRLSIGEYKESWNPFSGEAVELKKKRLSGPRVLQFPDECCRIAFKGCRVAIFGETDDESGYAEITILDKDGDKLLQTSVDFYSKTPAEGLRWLSPPLPKDQYTLEIRASRMKPNWTDKSKTQYGSKGYKVSMTEIALTNHFSMPTYWKNSSGQ